MYPITVRMEGKKVVVAGGGKVASFKIRLLLEAKADVTVVSKELCSPIRELVETSRVHWIQGTYKRSDFKDAFLIIAATDDKDINIRIEQEASEHQLVNVITDPERGNCHFPATLKQGKLLIAVSTGGASPKLAKHIRNQLQEQYNHTYEPYLEFLNECRILIKERYEAKAVRHQLLAEMLEDEYRLSLQKQEQFKERIRCETVDLR
ncbi:NAD(P)-binding protein [Ectobacillus antri]|uniref:precorrin-2 dehydrogenase n=1 Tax=Ectobacillus antri TaxID=2486280 RepID=A0ABT6H4E0_9BACI|nr:NAD(P)-binding protein [Ectobacillus antri]MDG4656858.1 NAD(P)-binding protein [Ectobacillus antri]MDG5754245.1 NAD(P)-binding protein [Ectobacillus antri]